MGTGSADNGSFTIAGKQLQTNAVFDFETKSWYSIRVRTTDHGGLWYEEALIVSVTDVDESPPIVTSLQPLDNATGVVVNMQLSLTFSEAIQKGTGVVVLKLATDGTTVETIAVGSAAVTVAGDTVTIARSVTLGVLTGYYVEVAAGAFEDLAGNDFAGISGLTAWNFTTQTFRVIDLHATASGLVATFNGPLATTLLNLYDGAEGTLGPPDVTVLSGAGTAVAGSLVVEDNLRIVEWVATGIILPPGTYTVTVKSGAVAFRDTAGNLLDGDSDGISGGDFLSSFTVLALPERVVRGPDFARGAGQSVYVPNAVAGLPIRLDNAAGVTSLAVELVYDPALLQITAAALAAGLPGDWSVTLNTGTAGVAKITASGTTALSGADREIVRLTAVVPSTAPYGAIQAIRLENVALDIEAGDAHAGGYTWTDADGSVLILPTERALAGARRERVWDDLNPRAELLESVLMDIAHEIASAWR